MLIRSSLCYSRLCASRSWLTWERLWWCNTQLALQSTMASASPDTGLMAPLFRSTFRISWADQDGEMCWSIPLPSCRVSSPSMWVLFYQSIIRIIVRSHAKVCALSPWNQMFCAPIHEALDTKFQKLDEGMFSKANLRRRFALRALVFGLNAFVTALFPFMGDFVNLFGSFTLFPLTFVFPSMVFIKVRQLLLPPPLFLLSLSQEILEVEAILVNRSEGRRPGDRRRHGTGPTSSSSRLCPLWQQLQQCAWSYKTLGYTISLQIHDQRKNDNTRIVNRVNVWCNGFWEG